VFGACLAEAAGVCLVDQRHAPGVVMTIDGEFFGSYSVCFPEVDERARRCWNDAGVATEHGAYAIALLLVTNASDYTVIERSRKGTGFDYWLGTADSGLFQAKARLEVSGIRSGDEKQLRARSRQKQEQVRARGGGIPAYVVIVEFGTPRGQVTRL
jgi:hypothetical protein